MIVFATKYGLTVEQVESLYRAGLLSYVPLRDAEMCEHYNNMITAYHGRRMDAMYDTMFHYCVSMTTVQRALKRWA